MYFPVLLEILTRLNNPPLMRLSSHIDIHHTVGTADSSFPDVVQWIVAQNLSGTNQIERREYVGDARLLKDIQANEFGISDSQDIQPILSTVWVGTCIAVAGYDRGKKAWFLVHIVSKEDVVRLIDEAFDVFGKYGLPSEIEFGLVWGMKGWKGSEETVREIYEYLAAKFPQGKIVYESLFPPKKRPGYFDPTSLLLDTRDGSVYYLPE